MSLPVYVYLIKPINIYGNTQYYNALLGHSTTLPGKYIARKYQCNIGSK